MNRSILIGIVALIMVATMGAQVASTVEGDLIKLENDWQRAIERKDRAFLQNLFTSEYLATDPDGITFTKSQELANLYKPDDVSSFVLSDFKVNVYCDTAVVTGRNTMKFRGLAGKEEYRFTDVFVKRDGRWQAVASHLSSVAKKSLFK